jgi:hypothetical protein
MRMKSFRPNDRLGRNAVNAAVTKAVASSVELSPAVAVGAVGEPVNAGWPVELSAPALRQRWQQMTGHY